MAQAAKIASHGVTGGLMSVLQKGKFGHGFAAASFTQAFAPSIDGIKGDQYSALRVAIAATIGGTASVLSGGKFANGAVTSAFSRLFNDEMPPHGRKGITIGEKRVPLLETREGFTAAGYGEDKYITALVDQFNILSADGEATKILEALIAAETEHNFRNMLASQNQPQTPSEGFREGVGMNTVTYISTDFDISKFGLAFRESALLHEAVHALHLARGEFDSGGAAWTHNAATKIHRDYEMRQLMLGRY